MIKNAILVSVIVGFVMCLAPVASADIMQDSVNWAGKYEANDFPDVESGFTDTGAKAISSVSAGVLTVDGSSTGGWVGWQLTGASWLGTSDNWSVEFRIKGISADGEGRMFYADFDNLANSNSALSLWNTEAAGTWVGFNNSGNWQGAGLTQNEFHTYRITVEDNGDSTYTCNVYFDDNPVAVNTRTDSARATSEDRLFFSVAGPTGMQFAVDHIRWTDQGAYAPLPEPGTMVLLGVGGVLTLVRRRRA